MNQEELDNWRRVLDALEAVGDRESGFYLRAQAICNGEPDPLTQMEQNS